MSDDVQLRAVEPADLELFLEFEHDPETVRRSKFTARERDVFMNHWQTRVLGDPTVNVQTCVVDGEPAGHLVAWWEDGRRTIGYVLGRTFWGRGIATKAMALFLDLEKTRPLYADPYVGNTASIRLLEKFGFGPEETAWYGSDEYLMLVLRRQTTANTEITHHFVEANGLRFHVAEAGTGPAVLLCHGFPELWYSWRHQIAALAAAGFRAIAPDLRGYGQSSAPEAIEQYAMPLLVGDLVGIAQALDAERAHLVGHDWGSALAWSAAQMRPDVFPTIVGMSVPFQPRREGRRPTEAFRAIAERRGLGEFYMVHFQQPGVAETEFEDDVDRTMRLMAHMLSGGIPAEETFKVFIPPGASMTGDIPTPEALPAWLSEDELTLFIDNYRRTGFRGSLNWYRNIDRNWELNAAYQGAKIHQPALFITGEHDPVRSFTASAERTLAESVPNLCEIVEIKGAGHWEAQENPAAVNEALLNFLEARRTLA
jgi:pimeloyl-ACP methyl ester carboxylesterase/RimJ/RimL family protein N-acetyltransferase